MGNRYACPNCQAEHRFQAALAGRMRRCGACGTFFRVPLVPVSVVGDQVWPDETRWLLRMGSGRQFGPVRRDIILEWLRERRADADCLVAPESDGQWFRLGDVFGAGVKPARDPLAAEETAAAWIPASGLLDFLTEWKGPWRGRGRAIARDHAAVMRAAEQECAGTGGLVRMRGSKLVVLTESHHVGLRGHGPQPLEAEAASVMAFTGRQGSEFYGIVPWSELGRMPHEFLSILPGQLPGPVALRRGSEQAFGGGCWIGITGDDLDVMAAAAARSREALSEGVQWDWFSRDRQYGMVQVWGVQALPMGTGKFAHLIQTSEDGARGGMLGLLWYLERQRAFYKFSRRLSLPDEGGTQVLFGCCGADFLCQAADALRPVGGGQ